MTYQEICSALRGQQMKKEASVKKLASIIGMKKTARPEAQAIKTLPDVVTGGMPTAIQHSLGHQIDPFAPIMAQNKPGTAVYQQPASLASRITGAARNGIARARKAFNSGAQRARRALTDAKSNAAYSLLSPKMKNVVNYSDPDGSLGGPVGPGLPATRRQYAPEVFKLQAALPVLDKVLPQRNDADKSTKGLIINTAIPAVLAPGLMRQHARYNQALQQYNDQVLPNRAKAEAWGNGIIPRFWR